MRGLPPDGAGTRAEADAVLAEEFRRRVPMLAGAVITLTPDNYPEKVIRACIPVLILFWAEWSGPCKTLGPALEELADQYENRVRVGRINIDEQPAMAAECGIRAVPTLLFVRRGKITDQIVGIRSRRELEESFDQAYC